MEDENKCIQRRIIARGSMIGFFSQQSFGFFDRQNWRRFNANFVFARIIAHEASLIMDAIKEKTRPISIRQNLTDFSDRAE